MTTCKRNRKQHLKHCNCTYCINLAMDYEGTTKIPCPYKGKCCECIKYHKERQELPACYFTEEQEKTYDRSIEFWWKSNHKCTCHSEIKVNKGFVTHINDKEVQGPSNFGEHGNA